LFHPKSISIFIAVKFFRVTNEIPPDPSGVKIRRFWDDFIPTRRVGKKLAGGDNHRFVIEGNPP
jgi:hypothetical protein